MLVTPGSQDLAALRKTLQEAGYDEQGLLALLGATHLPERLDTHLPHLLYLTREGKRLDVLVRLFLLGLTVTHSEAESALGADLLPACAGWGLIERRGDAVTACVRLTPFRSLLLAVDQPQRPEIARRTDQVMGVTPSTVTLANFTLRRPVRSTLDLGTGCGVQALLAAAHSERVVATDCNPRALEFARFNLQLNNVDKICLIQGDRFEPLSGSKFDLIVVNPPFAISPALRYYYRDSGEPADRFAETLVREAPEFLEEGGFLQMTLDWAERAGEDWRDRLQTWFAGSGCDAWVLRQSRQTAPIYAYLWVRDTEPVGPEQSGRLYREWMEYLERERIEAVSSGVLVMRRRSGRNWTRFDDVPGQIGPETGRWVELGFRLRDYLESTADDELLTARLRLSPDARLIEESEAHQGRWRTTTAHIRLSAGPTCEGRVDARIRGLLARMDGRQQLRDLLVHLAVELGVAPDKVIAQALPLVRDLMLRGFLLPESLSPDDASA